MTHSLFKKTFTGFMALFLAFCTFCLGSGINAFASEGEGHHTMMHEHDVDHDDHLSIENEADDEAHVRCCNDGDEMQVIKADDQVDDFDVTCDGSCDIWQGINDFHFDFLEHRFEPNAPPDDTKRRESERDSTKLRL